ncbi:hypothetical protein AOG28_17080 [Cobetia sp. UCD-24C]|nr:hypothetical protein AOG28_17080 [Cobetia sp. UCD-24C]
MQTKLIKREFQSDFPKRLTAASRCLRSKIEPPYSAMRLIIFQLNADKPKWLAICFSQHEMPIWVVL